VRAAIIDLNFSVLYGHPAGAKGRVDERGTNCIFPADGFSAAAPIPPLCEALRRPSLRDSKLHLGTGCWHVESFFRWIKHWVALPVYALAAIVKKRLALELNLYKILPILSVTVFEKKPTLEGFSNFSDGFRTPGPCIH
jgi:hypothetical protein